MCGQHLSHMSLKLLSPTHLIESGLCEQVWLYHLYKDILLSADGNHMAGSMALTLGAAGCGSPFSDAQLLMNLITFSLFTNFIRHYFSILVAPCFL